MEGKDFSLKEKIYEVIDVSNGHNLWSTVYDYTMMVTILLSIVPLTIRSGNAWTFLIDKITVAIFIADYILRLWTADIKFKKKSWTSYVRYPFSVLAIIDLLSILPSFLPLNMSLKILRTGRMLRAVKVIKLFRALRYSKSIQIISNVLHTSKDSLIAVCVFAGGYILASALVIYNVEPESFPHFFDAIYWATVSLTTVGYGDIYPVSTIGRVVTMISSFFGIAIVALPAGIITAGYMKEINSSEKTNA